LSFGQDRVDNVSAMRGRPNCKSQQLKVGLIQKFDNIVFNASEKVIRANNIMPLVHQSSTQVRTEKTRAARH
jgi:hypothetical protein